MCAWRRRFRPDGQQGTREPQIPAEEDGQAQGADDHERPRESRHHDPRELSEDGPAQDREHHDPDRLSRRTEPRQVGRLAPARSAAARGSAAAPSPCSRLEHLGLWGLIDAGAERNYRPIREVKCFVTQRRVCSLRHVSSISSLPALSVPSASVAGLSPVARYILSAR